MAPSRRKQRWGTDTKPYAVAVGDFNRDGKVDLAVANQTGDGVSILLGNGDGTFQTAVNWPVGTSPEFVAVGDFNGDGIPDLVVANTVSFNVTVMLGNGDGASSPARRSMPAQTSRGCRPG